MVFFSGPETQISVANVHFRFQLRRLREEMEVARQCQGQPCKGKGRRPGGAFVLLTMVPSGGLCAEMHLDY